MIVSNKHPIIAKEGWLYVVLALLGFVISLLYLPLALSFLVFIVFVATLFFFRDPIRVIPPSPLGIVSPVDGLVTSVIKVDNTYTSRTSVCITVQMSALGVYSLRSPIEGKMVKQWGKGVDGKHSLFNWVQTDEGDDVI